MHVDGTMKSFVFAAFKSIGLWAKIPPIYGHRLLDLHTPVKQAHQTNKKGHLKIIHKTYTRDRPGMPQYGPTTLVPSETAFRTKSLVKG